MKFPQFCLYITNKNIEYHREVKDSDDNKNDYLCN